MVIQKIIVYKNKIKQIFVVHILLIWGNIFLTENMPQKSKTEQFKLRVQSW